MKINEVLPVAFCPICMLFMCPKHLESKSEQNSWVFERLRQIPEIVNFDLKNIENERHLKDWVHNYEQA